jgi:tRNA nucleotidyltransferase/poly(A) polymerase
MDINCTEKELFVFDIIGKAAAGLGEPAYLIGGFVRDKLIGRPTKDADIVCAGDGIELAHQGRSHARNPNPQSPSSRTSARPRSNGTTGR